MTTFKIGDLVKLKNTKGPTWRIIGDGDSSQFDFRIYSKGSGGRWVYAEEIESVDQLGNLKQAIREVLLSDEFMKAFVEAFLASPIPLSLKSIYHAEDDLVVWNPAKASEAFKSDIVSITPTTEQPNESN
jgi:hypothetical protein